MPKLSGSSRRSRFSGLRGIPTLIICICLGIVLVTLYAREGSTGPVHTLRTGVQVVVTPFDWLGSQMERPFDAIGNTLSNTGVDEETLSALKEENASLTAQLSELSEYRLENERLRALLDLSSAYGAEGVGARVIGLSSGNWSSTITIDAGTDAGLAVDMAVTDGNGVVGQISEVSQNSSIVMLISDPSYQVSAMLQSSRAVGVLTSSVDGSLHLEYIPVTEEVEVGEVVVTSGLGGAYPKGLMLGSVASVTSSPTDVYLTIVVTPLATVENYEEVFVITSYDEATAEVAAEAFLTTGSYVPEEEEEIEDEGEAGAITEVVDEFGNVIGIIEDGEV